MKAQAIIILVSMIIGALLFFLLTRTFIHVHL